MNEEDAELILTAAFFADSGDEASLREIDACELVDQIEIEGAFVRPRLVKKLGKVIVSFRIDKEVGTATQQELNDLGYIYERASDGDVQFMYEVGTRLEIGRGITRDLEQALLFYQRAADAGYARALPRIRRLRKDKAFLKWESESNSGESEK